MLSHYAFCFVLCFWNFWVLIDLFGPDRCGFKLPLIHFKLCDLRRVLHLSEPLFPHQESGNSTTYLKTYGESKS